MTLMMDTITTVPIVNVQPSFPSVLQDVLDGLIPHEDVWVSCYLEPPSQSSSATTRSVHSKLQAVLDESNRDQINLITKEGDAQIQGDSRTKSSFQVECTSLGTGKTTVITPLQEYSDPDVSNPRQPQRITAFDVSPDETQFAVGHLDGSVYIYPTTPVPFLNEKYSPQTIQPAIKKRGKPHLSGVSCLQFFPSSRVLLTAGLDFTLTIFPAEPFHESPQPEPQRLAPVRTMRSHTRSITAIGVVAPGKNVLSASLDSTVKIWDVPSGSVLSTLLSRSPVLSMAVGDRVGVAAPMNGSGAMAVDDHRPQIQPETENQLALCGLQNGTVEIFDLRTRSSIDHSSTSSGGGGLSAIAYSPTQNLFVTGSTKGIVAIYDIRGLTSAGPRPLGRFKRNSAGVEDIAFVTLNDSGEGSTGTIGLAIATTDGLPYIAGLQGEDPRVAAELVGVDCDSVRGVRVGNGSVWCASDDSIVRRYSMS